MAELYESGLTIRQIATELGFHRETVSHALKRANVKIRRSAATIDLDLVDRLKANGRTLTEIADELHVGRSTLVRARRNART